MAFIYPLNITINYIIAVLYYIHFQFLKQLQLLIKVYQLKRYINPEYSGINSPVAI